MTVTPGGIITGQVRWKSADSIDMENAIPTTCDMTPDELHALKTFLDQGTIRSNWDAGTWLSHWLLGAEMKIGPVFEKTEQMKRIAAQLGYGTRKVWHSLEIQNSWLPDEVDLAEKSNFSLRRAIEALPARKKIKGKPEELDTLKRLIATNPGKARQGEALELWKKEFEAFIEKYTESTRDAQEARLSKSKKAAAAALDAAHAELEKVRDLLPTKLRGGCKTLLGKIDEVVAGVQELYAEAEKHFAADADSGISQPTKKRTRTSPLDEWTSGS